MLKSFALKFSISILVLSLSKIVYAQGNFNDQYKQMGGIAGLSELCFKSKKIEPILSRQIGQLLYDQPESFETIIFLMFDYWDAKNKAITDNVIWNGKAKAYNKKKFSCKNKADKELIKNFELQFINGLKSQG